jgi:rhodanese-related sulfurtransferase
MNLELSTQDVPNTQQTTLGLYATPREAYAMWQANPEGVTILDVRSIEEYVFGGHPPMAKNVPLAFLKFERPAAGAAPAAPEPGRMPPGFSIDPNEEFIPEVKDFCGPDETILAMCGSGGRAAHAVNALSQAGFKNVYNIVNGFDGEMVLDRADPDFGKTRANGWKDLGLPWGRNLNPDLLWENAKQ